jgi:hypothetical protein
MRLSVAGGADARRPLPLKSVLLHRGQHHQIGDGKREKEEISEMNE